MTKIISTKKELKSFTETIKNKVINFIPTMGSFHDGHLKLIKKAKQNEGITVVSIFVNSTQFNENADFLNYPRNLKDDIVKLKYLNVDYAIIPEDGFLNKRFPLHVNFKKYDNILCAKDRPGHFDGVVKVMMKFLFIVDPDFIFLGKKDFQQMLIIQELLDIFYLKAKIVGVETVREKDGLALSSRNLLLSKTARKKSLVIIETLKEIKKNLKLNGILDYEFFVSNKIRKLNKSGLFKIKYLELRKEKDLSIIDENFSKCRIFICAFVNGVRLIDNISIGVVRKKNKKIYLKINDN